jgi:GT2 family glycosyltransferase
MTSTATRPAEAAPGKTPAGSAAGGRAAAPLVSIVIKALNEEAKIARAIESSLAALERDGIPGEVILADSLSTDRTVEIASAYPIKIVQLVDQGDRSCGVGAHLGMAAVSGEYVYVLDGDMEMEPGFFPAAVEAMREDPRLAGVAGLVQEMLVTNLAFQRRVKKSETGRAGDNAVCLEMGGLYRRSAIEQIGYLTNRNLHAFEELELGVRLTSAGWRLRRLGIPAVKHYGHTDASLALLLRRWRSNYSMGQGELLRQAWGRPHFVRTLKTVGTYKVVALVATVWTMLFLALLLPEVSLLAWPLLVVVVWGSMFALLALRERSVQAAAYALVSWHVGLAGTVRGVLATPRGAPEDAVAFRVVK